MHIFGKRIDGYDLVLAIIGVVLVLFGIGAFVGFLTLRSGTGRFVLLGVSIAMFAGGLGLLNSTVFKAVRKRTGLGGKEPPAIDG
jgi:uncharacterized membrane protein